MVSVGIVLDSALGMSYPHLSEVFEKCLEMFCENTNEKANVLDIILLHDFKSSEALDEALNWLYGASRQHFATRSMQLTPVNVLFGDFSVVNRRYEQLYVENTCLSHSKWLDLLQNLSESYHEFTTPNDIKYDYNSKEEDCENFDLSAVGGTFDHLHDGHKILLSIASFLTKKRLIVGISDKQLLVNKSYPEYLESYTERSLHIKNFLAMIKPSLEVTAVALNDPCGPTGNEPDIEALIVSQETVSGAEFVNKTRASKGLQPLNICVVKLLSMSPSSKLSSTYIRQLLHEQTELAK